MHLNGVSSSGRLNTIFTGQYVTLVRLWEESKNEESKLNQYFIRFLVLYQELVQ